jgi:hypothetical protein
MTLYESLKIPRIIVTSTDSYNLELSNVEYKLTKDLYLYTQYLCLVLSVFVMSEERKNTHKIRTVTFYYFASHRKKE